ncbi:MAG: pilus assembly protein PilV [Rubrivivax sp.]|nr:pilus assembly protein PilV [Rubrivivax sp.]
MKTTAWRTRGVSLIEALVALAVMAFGLLGVVGMQATLRSNSDVSKQRAQAVRIAQQEVENLRAFEQLASGGVANFADIADVAGQVVVDPNLITNATYTRSVVVMPAAMAASAPKLKTVTLRVTWQDRAGQTPEISLVSSIAGIAPELAGSLGLPGDRSPAQRPLGRHVAIPPGAVDQGDGTSIFAPPGAPPGLTWVFNNTTGVITSLCLPAAPCVASDLLVLSGHVRFATGAAPTPAEGEFPSDAALPGVGVAVDLTVPAVSTETCFKQAFATHVSYFCALPTTALPPSKWSGRAVLTGLPISAALADVNAARYKVCRYTPAQNHVPPLGNTSHPLDYVNVTGPLANQNFLVISAGDGAVAFDCPADGPSAFINSNTYRHQPLL